MSWSNILLDFLMPHCNDYVHGFHPCIVILFLHCLKMSDSLLYHTWPLPVCWSSLHIFWNFQIKFLIKHLLSPTPTCSLHSWQIALPSTWMEQERAADKLLWPSWDQQCCLGELNKHIDLLTNTIAQAILSCPSLLSFLILTGLLAKPPVVYQSDQESHPVSDLTQ